MVPDAAADERPDARPDARIEAERDLIEAAKRGDLDAMRPVFQAYTGPLYSSVIRPRLGDSATAEDVLRDTFATALQKLDGFQWTSRGIYPWLRQIAVNKVHDVHRGTQRSRRLIDALAVETPAEVSPEERPDLLLIAAQSRRESRRRIDDTLARLPQRYRRAIELRLIDELPREACADLLDVKLGTFDVLFYRAARAFRKAYGERGE